MTSPSENKQRALHSERQKKQKEEILAAIKEVADKLGRAPMSGELEEMTGGKIYRAQINRRFGNYGAALEQCGLARQDHARPRTMLELFTLWATATRKVGKVPTITEFHAATMVSSACLVRRFRRWSLVKSGMQKFMELEKLEGEWADVAEIMRKQSSASSLRAQNGRTFTARKDPEQTSGLTEERLLKRPKPNSDKPMYGEPIGHPAMANAPINEAGVLALFAAMAPELGFILTRVQSAFPDVEALRRMEGGRLQLTLAELEFESRGFVEHRHNPKGCDLLVCWVHNWKECPLEVIELSRFFGR